MTHNRYLIVSLLVIAISCTTDTDVITREESLLEVAHHFDPIPFPDDNLFTIEKWELGKALFFDVRLSKDNSISCASCHDPAKAFSDDKPVSLGVENRAGRRNASPLFNLAYAPYYTREGGIPTLEMQALIPIQEHDEFDHNIVLITEKLADDVNYQTMSQAVFQRDLDPYAITRALGTFQRTIISQNSKFDNVYLDKDVYDEKEKSGHDLFFSEKLGCNQCHTGLQFTDYSFANNGLYSDYKDEGRARLTSLESDRALFKVPSLRNVEVTAPYMHDGSIVTLEEVIEHYSDGIADHANLDKRIQSFSLTPKEKNDLLAFLYTLTDYEFLSNPLFKK